MNTLKTILSLLVYVSIFFITSCKGDTRDNVNFYYWKANVSIGDTEKEYFEKLNSKKLYIRYFDVDVEDKHYTSPKAKVKSFDSSILDADYVPVIFIVNDVFKDDVYDSSPKTLTNDVLTLMNLISEKNNISYDEIQIDCDWTASTADKYFSFLQQLAKISGKEITCTLRLHQIKDRNTTGVPPVSKGYLMCYATSSPKEKDVENSILDLDLVKSYTKDIETYPLPLAIALPIYSWGVVTNHLGNIRLINNIDISNISEEFLKKTGSNIYEVQEDFFLQGLYLNKGFTIRIEAISPELLRDTRHYLDKKLNKDYEIVYYHLDKPFLENYTIDQLKD